MQEKTLDWSQNYIRDGFTQDGYIAPMERRHGELRFKFRPMLPEDFEEFDVFRNSNILKPKAVVSRLAKECSDRLVAWSEQVDGKDVPIGPDYVKRLRHTLLSKLFQVIAGERASDEDPQNKSLPEDVQDEPSSKDPLEQLGN